jgi:hypothetical protein
MAQDLQAYLRFFLLDLSAIKARQEGPKRTSVDGLGTGLYKTSRVELSTVKSPPME